MVEHKNNKIKLEDIPKTNSFKVPEGYFDNFQSRMANRIIKETDRKHPKPVFIALKPRIIGVVTLSVAALVIVGLIIFSPKDQSIVFSESELAEIYQYSAINESSEIDLIKQLESTMQVNEQIDIFTSKNEDFNTQALDYLSGDNVDINALIDAL
jgi:hypothetical protein